MGERDGGTQHFVRAKLEELARDATFRGSEGVVVAVQPLLHPFAARISCICYGDSHRP